MRLAALVLAGGCSFALVHGPKSGHSECTTSNVVPIIDTAFAAAAFALLVTTLVTSDSQLHDLFCDQYDASCSPNRAGIATLSAIVAGADGAGAYWGFTKTNECRNASSSTTPPTAPVPTGSDTTPVAPTAGSADSGSGSGSGSAVRSMPSAPVGVPLP
ncbi:MAG: hypothetical protein QM831_40710 [Kofleriaceae bacterium]